MTAERSGGASHRAAVIWVVVAKPVRLKETRILGLEFLGLPAPRSQVLTRQATAGVDTRDGTTS